MLSRTSRNGWSTASHRLGASEKTVKVHRARVMGKMKADSLADLVRMTM